MIFILILLLASCSPVTKEQQEISKYPNVPTYGVVFEIQQEEKKWNQEK